MYEYKEEINKYRERKNFSKIKTTLSMPNFMDIQRKSYHRFLQMELMPEEREEVVLVCDSVRRRHQWGGTDHPG